MSFYNPLLTDSDDDYDLVGPLSNPPPQSVIGIWKTGENDNSEILCALVKASSEDLAWEDVIFKQFPNAIKRFSDEIPENWNLSDRFYTDNMKDWMKERIEKWKNERKN
jgi:hypothetical protein